MNFRSLSWILAETVTGLDDNDSFLILKAMAHTGYLNPATLIDARIAIQTKPFIYLAPSFFGANGGLYVGKKNGYHNGLIEDISEDNYSMSSDMMSLYHGENTHGDVGRIGSGINFKQSVDRYDGFLNEIAMTLKTLGMDDDKIDFVKNNLEVVDTLLSRVTVVSLYRRNPIYTKTIVDDLLGKGYVYPARTFLVRKERGDSSSGKIGKIEDRGEMLECWRI